jgi:hypothetical protein
MRPIVRTVSSRAPSSTRPPGHFHVLRAHRVGHLRDRDVESAQLVGVDPDLNLARAAADDL